MILLDDLLDELQAAGLQKDLVSSGSPQLGSDLAMPCFTLAHKEGVDPQKMAEQIVATISHPALKKAQAVKGYVNLWLDSRLLVRKLKEIDFVKHPLSRQKPKNSKVIIEYFAPNLAKPLSAGHLRNLFQGRALTNLYKTCGYEVVTDNHLGDWGKVFGMWVVAYLKYGQESELADFTLEELGRLYKKLVQALDQEKKEGGQQLEDQIQGWFLKLQAGDQEAWSYHRHFTDISLRGMQPILDDLEIQFDEQLGESFYHKDDYSLKLLKELKARDIVQVQADNSWVIDLKKEGLKTPLLVLKSNGGTLYATADVAVLKYRQDRWQPDRVIYVVGSEQQFYFKQLFACNKISQLSSAELVHHSYGLIEELDEGGKRQKMSSRQGSVELKEVLNKAYQLAESNNKKGLSDADLKIIAHGALTFKEFCQSRKHNVLFDWQKLFSLSDMSGSYVQYATLRLKSLLSKAEIKEYRVSLDYDWRAEHQLMLKLLKIQDVLDETIMYSDLHRLAVHVFELSKELNRYYEDTFVLTGEASIQASRLWLMDVIYKHLVASLKILGLKIPSQM